MGNEGTGDTNLENTVAVPEKVPGVAQDHSQDLHRHKRAVIQGLPTFVTHDHLGARKDHIAV